MTTEFANSIDKQIINATEDMIAYIDLNYCYQTVNQSYLNFHNKTESELIGKKVSDVVGEENFLHFKPLLERAFNDESFTIKGEYNLPESDVKRYEEGRFAPLKDALGEVKGVVITIRETTKQELVSQKAEQEHKRAERYLNIAGVMLLTLDENANITLLNKKGCEILGYQEDELLGKNWIDHCIPKGLQEHIHQVFADVIAGKIHYPHYNENEVITKTGERRLIAWHNVLVKDDQSNIIGTLSSGEDITQSRKALTALQSSESRLNEAQKIAKIGSWELNLRDHKLWWSDQIYKIFEIDADKFDATYEAFIASIHPDDRVLVDEAFQYSIKRQQPYEIVHRLLMDDGRIKYVQEQGKTLYDEAGVALKSVGTVQDITELYNNQLTIKDQEAFLHAIVEQIPHVLFVKDAKTHKYIRVNKAFKTLFGLSKDEIIGKSDYDFFTKEEADFNVTKDNETLRGKQVVDIPQETLDTKKSGKRTFHTKKIPILDDGGRPLYLLGLAEDITATLKSEMEREQFVAIIQNMSEGAIITDYQNRIVAVNRAYKNITGYLDEDVLGQNPSFLQSKKHDDEFYQRMWKTINDEGEWRGEIWNRRKDGSEYPLHLSISTIKDENNQVINHIGIFTDLSALKESEEKIEYQALHDALTDIPNRLMLSSRLNHAIDSAERKNEKVALFYLDLDDFKRINDTYGHDTGDTILVEVVERLKSALCELDLLTRFSGDEFIILSEELESIAQTAELAQKILTLFKKPFIINNTSHFIGVSMGITLFPDDAKKPQDLIKSAGTAMHRAKSEGKNQYAFYTQELTEKLFEQLMIENSIREAIATEQFELYYQPQIALDDKKIVGFESLIRWNHRELGMISPMKFIPIAEKTKLIIPLGAWILKQVCHQAKAWSDMGLFQGRIAVNVSGVQMEHSDFLQTLKNALAESQLDPLMLEIEITESFLMKNPQQWIYTLKGIKELGISISIDDFGTGYSSLAYLRHFPLDKLKIDKSFIDDIPEESDACSIASAIVALANSMGFSTIAEGVESEEQVAFLKSIGCNKVQGYFFDRPLQVSMAQERLKDALGL